jgi:hypothetical protein
VVSDGGLDIHGGGVVAVDTSSLRAAADRYAAERADIEEVHRILAHLAATIGALVGPGVRELASRARMLAERAADAADRAEDLASGLRRTADVYEIAELLARRAAAEATGDDVGVARAAAGLRALMKDHPDAVYDYALRLGAERLDSAFALVGQAWREPFSLLTGATGAAAVALGFAGSVALLGRGSVPRGATLSGAPQGADVTLRHVGSTTAPTTLQTLAERVPTDGGRITVERYAMRDGTSRYVVYVAGTRTWTMGGDDPWDMSSNLDLYQGKTSASYGATLEALREAGAEPGDVVYAVGHSQGAMIASHVATDAGFDTRMLVTLGSPIESDVGTSTLSIQLRHSDDPVSALAGAGSPAPVGAPGSFIAERVADPLPGSQDLVLAAHHLESYADTAGMLDRSSDPRMDAVRANLAELAGATSVESLQFDASRGDVPRSGGGGG